MSKKISYLFEDCLILVIQIAFWAYVVALVLLASVGVLLPVFSQALEWL